MSWLWKNDLEDKVNEGSNSEFGPTQNRGDSTTTTTWRFAQRDRVHQNQRWVLGLGWSSRALLPTERGEYSGGNKQLQQSLDHHIKGSVSDCTGLPENHHWVWRTEWEPVLAGGDCDAEGWQYAPRWIKPGEGNWSNSMGRGHFVRRRRWVRLREWIGEASQGSVMEEAEERAVEEAVEQACALDPPISPPDELQKAALVQGRCIDPSEIRSLLLEATLLGPGDLEMPTLTLEDEIDLMTSEAEEMLANGISDGVCSKRDIHRDDNSDPLEGIKSCDQGDHQSEEVDLGVLLLDADGIMADMPSLNLPSPTMKEDLSTSDHGSVMRNTHSVADAEEPLAASEVSRDSASRNTVADGIRAKYGRPPRQASGPEKDKVEGVHTSEIMQTMTENQEKLGERGDKLAHLGERSSQLERDADSFAEMAKQLAKKQQGWFSW